MIGTACGERAASSVDAPPVISDADAADAADAAIAGCDEPFAVKAATSPPFAGTVFIDPDVIRSDEASSFAGLQYTGQGQRTMFDRRTNSFNTVNAHLFAVRFGTSKMVEVQVNPEFARADAEVQATFYSQAIGRMPGFLFRDVQTVWIHVGKFPFGGGNNNLLIHTAQGEEYSAMGVLEETFLHEGAHTSLDLHHATKPRWLEAQQADGTFVSSYARDFPDREDVAETLVPYLAVRFRADRIDAATATAIQDAIPARLKYFDCEGLTMNVLP